MHTIPDKLNALRQSVEAGQIRHNVELRQEFDKKLTLSVEAAEESAYNRAVDLVVPRIDANVARLDEELPKVATRMNEVVTICHTSADALRAEVDAKIKSLQLELSGLVVELPPLRNHIKDNSEAVQRLEAFPAEMQQHFAAMRTEMESRHNEMFARLDNECRRAEAAESMLRRQIDDTAERASLATKAAEQRAREQAAAAVNHASGIQDRLLAQIDASSRKSIEESRNHALDISATIAPAIEKAIAQVMKKVDENNDLGEMRLSKMENMIRDDFQTIVADVSEAFERSTELKMAELSVTMSENLEITKRDIAGVREAGKKALEDAIADFFVRVEEVRASLDGKSHELQTTILEGEQRLVAKAEQMMRADHAGLIAEVSEQVQVDIDLKLAAVSLTMSDNLDMTRKELADAQDSSRVALDTWSVDFQRRMIELQNTLDSKGKELQTHVKEGFKDINQRMGHHTTETLSMISKEREARCSSLAEMEDNRAKELHEKVVDLQASLASSAAEVAARYDGTNRRVDSMEQKVVKAGQDMQAFTGRQSSVIEQFRAQIAETREEVQTATNGFKEALEAQKLRSADDLTREAAALQEEILQTRNVVTEGLTSVQTALPALASKEEVAVATMTAKSAFDASSDVSSRINVFESAVDRLREWFDDHSKDMAARCQDAQSQASDAKFRTQRETTTLGSEISLLRGAATALTHGVVMTLQIIGLLTEDLDVLPPKSTDGTSPLLPRRWGVDVADLLEWEKKGQGLASRLQRQWAPFKEAGLPNLLSLVERKANEADVRMLRGSLSQAIRLVSPDEGSQSLIHGGKPWTPSTMADDDIHRGPSALSRVTATTPNDLSDFRGFSPSPPPVSQSPNGPRRPPGSSKTVLT